jgi:hypothetical protein
MLQPEQEARQQGQSRGQQARRLVAVAVVVVGVTVANHGGSSGEMGVLPLSRNRVRSSQQRYQLATAAAVVVRGHPGGSSGGVGTTAALEALARLLGRVVGISRWRRL